MPSSLRPDEVVEIARALCTEPVRSVVELRKGKNSRVYRVDTASDRFALKRYPASDSRNRLGAELDAVRFFERRRIGRTPRVVAAAPECRFALFTWIEGEAVTAVTDRDVEAFADFQIAIDAAIDQRAREDVGEASEACLSGSRVVASIEQRFARLAAVKEEVPGFAALFDNILVPSLHRFQASARDALGTLGLDFSQDLAPDWRTLIPSDLGAHNALRDGDGNLHFLDFEYFGWDDPITSIANFIMHPGMTLTPSQRNSYRDRLLGHFCRHCEAERLAGLMPLYVLRWCAIILGELLPERWNHRQDSNADMDDWDQARRTQVRKVRDLIEQSGVFG